MRQRIRRWEPVRDLVSLREAMDRLFEESFVRPSTRLLAPLTGLGLPVDIVETGEAVIVTADVPGAEADDMDITITGDTLTIRVEVPEEEEVEEGNYLRRERYRGTLCRSVPLPAGLQADDAKATFKNGVLTLEISKVEEARARTIKVQAT